MAKARNEQEVMEEEPTQEPIDGGGWLMELKEMYGDQAMELAATRNKLKKTMQENEELKRQLVAVSQNTAKEEG